MSKNNENTNKVNHFNNYHNKNYKKVDLCQKYFYKYNLSYKKNNIFQLMENGTANQNELEEVDNACTEALTKRNELEAKQIECLRSMILHHKKIPEKWIIQRNYKELLDKVMSDPIVLSYAIFSKDIYKKRSTSVSLDPSEIENNMKNEFSVRPKFISYINPYSKNYSNSIEKHRLMRDYCNNVKTRKNKKLYNINTINVMENNDNKSGRKDRKKYYLNTENSKECVLPNIFNNLRTNKNSKKDEREETFMMTSIYYDENNLNKDNNNNSDKKNNASSDRNKNSPNKKETNTEKKELELPMIEI